MIVKVHFVRGKKILVIIDSDLLDKKFEENVRQLDLTADFYKGEEKTEQDIESMVQDAYIIHLVGEKSVNLALKNNWIDSNNVIRISKIPHAEVVIVSDS
jgi:hypothetical protein